MNSHSNQRGERSEASHGLCEAGCLKRLKVLGHSLGWLLEALPLFLGSRTDIVRSQVQQVSDELIRVLCLDSKLGQRFGGEVREIAG